MAFYGLAFPTIAKLNVSTGNYSNGFRFGKAVSLNLTISENEAPVYGDNILAEYVKEFKEGSVALGITTLPIAAYNTVFGHEVTTEETSINIVDKSDDLANYVGLGLIKYEMVNGEKNYIAIWLYKVLFSESGETATTSGENISFQTPAINGKISALPDKRWRERRIFKSEVAAQAWVDSMAKIVDICTTPEASLESGIYAVAQAAGITLAAGAGETIYYTTNGTTPSPENGTQYTVPINITTSCALKAIAVKDGKSASAIAVYEYIISI
jgi:phi13 family phage major tail protein